MKVVGVSPDIVLCNGTASCLASPATECQRVVQRLQCTFHLPKDHSHSPLSTCEQISQSMVNTAAVLGAAR